VASSHTLDVSAPTVPPLAFLSPLDEKDELTKISTGVHYAPSAVASVHTTSTRMSGGTHRARSSRASLQSGQVDLLVKPVAGGPARTNGFQSDNSVISRDLLPRLENEQEDHDTRFASLRNAFDWRFFLFAICNPKEYIWPMTFRRLAFWILYGGIATGLYLLKRYYSWAHGMAFAFRYV
jgi:hypothetical protein